MEQTKGEFGVFDLIICDEAHRTTKACCDKKLENTPAFLRVHNNDLIKARRRLYMTATPRIYTENAKARAKEQASDVDIASMDDENIFGKEFHRISFNDAVQKGLLTDYKVIVLTVSERVLPDQIIAETENPKRVIDIPTAAKLEELGLGDFVKYLP